MTSPVVVQRKYYPLGIMSSWALCSALVEVVTEVNLAVDQRNTFSKLTLSCSPRSHAGLFLPHCRKR